MADKAMDRLINEGKLKKVIDQRLIKALSHPLRAHLLATLNERIASPREMAEEIGLDVAFLSYHVRVLKDFGCIELVETDQKRGAIEHFYRARTAFFLDDRAWRRLPVSLKSDVTADLLQSIFTDALGALRSGSFDGDSHVSWTPVLLDRKGMGEMYDALSRALEWVMAIQGESAERMARTGEDGTKMTVAITGFERTSASAEGGWEAPAGGD